jgi:hypothetical protein
VAQLLHVVAEREVHLPGVLLPANASHLVGSAGLLGRDAGKLRKKVKERGGVKGVARSEAKAEAKKKLTIASQKAQTASVQEWWPRSAPDGCSDR